MSKIVAVLTTVATVMVASQSFAYDRTTHGQGAASFERIGGTVVMQPAESGRSKRG